MSDHINRRRYDLDWLRVIAFGLLIFYHIGMFYVSWGWHVKSVHAGPALEPTMKLLNPWRLTLLFLISGIAIRFALDKARLITFTWQRTLRLFIPIAFGIHVIVAPQSYLQLLESGEIMPGFWHFYKEYLIGSSDYSVVIPTWNHLWYVVYLMFYTLLLIPVSRPLARFMSGRGAQITERVFANKFGVLVLFLLGTCPFILYHLWLRPRFPSTHALVGDWANHQLFFTIFIFGFLIAKDAGFWRAIDRAFKPALIGALLIGLTAALVWQFDMKHSASAALNTVEFFSERSRKTLYAWLCIIALLGAAQKWLNRPSKALTYMTEAIFPWYILHQTLTIIAGYWLTRQGLSAGPEFILVTLATFLGCALGHEIFIRRWTWVRPLFGLKRTSMVFSSDSKRQRPANQKTELNG